MALTKAKIERGQKRAWKIGYLGWKLLPHEIATYKRVHEVMKNPVHRKLILHKARRIGKSYILCDIAIEKCISKPNARVRYAASTAKSVRNFIRPIIADICMDCPEDIAPIWNGFDGLYRFPNGSELHVAGVNSGHEDDLRGPASDLAIVDEAGFIDNLRYVVDSVLMPQLISTNGICIVASSSPETPAHEFVSYIELAKQEDMYVSGTIYDAQYTPEEIASFCKEAGGENSTFWKREYLNHIIVDESRAIVPEWKTDYVQAIEPDKYREFYHNYDAMDLGVVVDKTAVLFGYYDFLKAKLIVENEFSVKGPDLTTDMLKDRVIMFEKETFGNMKVYRRISDNNNPMLINDLGILHGIHFGMTSKDELHAMVNELRLLVAAGRLIVHPRCKELIGCLSTGIWNKTRREFDHSTAYGHYDALAALVYLSRNLDQNTNPIPATYGLTMDHYIGPEMMRNKAAKEMSKLFKAVRQ